MSIMSCEVCRSCRLSRGESWIRMDDLLWGPWMLDNGLVVSGRVSCPFGRDMTPLSVPVGEVEMLPKGCPYIAEHAVCGCSWDEYFDRRQSVSVYELHKEGLVETSIFGSLVVNRQGLK